MWYVIKTCQLLHTCISINRIKENSCVKVERSQSKRHYVVIKRENLSELAHGQSCICLLTGFPTILGCIL